MNSPLTGSEGDTESGSVTGTGGSAGAAGTVTDDGSIAGGPSSTNTGGTSNAAGWTPTIETDAVDNGDTVSSVDGDAIADANRLESTGCGCRIANPGNTETSGAFLFGLAFLLSGIRFRRLRWFWPG